MSGKRREIEEEPEECENHERWLVSYADMLTLLMVLFIVMYAVSQVDQIKFAALRVGLQAGFGSPIDVMPGGAALLDPGGNIAPDSVNLSGDSAGDTPSAAIDPQARTLEATEKQVAELAKATEEAQVSQEVKKLQKAMEKLKEALAQAGMRDAASFRFDERGLVATIATDKVLFENASAAMRPQGKKILDILAPTLRSLPNRMSIDGHTNRVPINTARYPSNWELSAIRATGVLRYLAWKGRISAQRMSATGYAATRERLPPSDPRSISANRRVEIVVLAIVDNSAGRAVEELGNKG
jgi:chemotaxis protein MotB